MATCTNIIIDNQQSSPTFALREQNKLEPFCSFCLLERPQNVEFYKHVIGASQEMRNSLQYMLGYDFNLANFAICKPCWKVIQLIQDFRLRCFKANEVVQRMTKGLSNDVDDGWFSAKNLATIESVRMGVQDQMRHIETINTTKRVLVLDDSADEVAVGENNNQGDEVDSSDARSENSETQESSIEQEVAANIEMDEARSAQHECLQCHRMFKSKKGLNRHGPFCVHHMGIASWGAAVAEWLRCSLFKDIEILEMLNMNEKSKSLEAGFEPPSFGLCTQNCDKLFFSEPRRAHHERICAENARNLACLTCGKRFKTRTELRTHERCQHSENARIFPCKVCGKMFKQQYAVTLYMSSHATSEPFVCQLCPMKYWCKQSLTNHLKKMHAD
ncbi:conserved hypothetical protein [Culex quinquefasciatus]|uniref:C2H2-type domain-containing protein n=1 Tax=Culex quinquefasciatus TaxID=7176 RepID=B0WIF5_CULQU|nr:conserved hypothetical protein [Culex quinquefasciatus]|eukprot:XP_001848489.1 conserved hypothetical protein [Culex quinquefasciatus]